MKNTDEDDTGFSLIFDVFDDSIETVVFVRGVRDYSSPAVRFQKGVLSLDSVAVSRFPLTLDVVCVQIVDSVIVVILRFCLKETESKLKTTI